MIKESVSVYGVHNDIPLFGFSTYAWSYPEALERGIHKNGITRELKNPGKHRMNQSVKKTGTWSNPKVLENYFWPIPLDIVGSDRNKANKFARRFDKECNKKLSKFKIKNLEDNLIGEEWYKTSVENVERIRKEVFDQLIGKERLKSEEENNNKKIVPYGLQPLMTESVLNYLKSGCPRFKGIAPTGIGKTLVAWDIFTKAFHQNLIGKIGVMTAPSQFLCNKNSEAFKKYNKCNGINNIYNLAIYSGSDVGFQETEVQFTNRKDSMKSMIRGYLREPNSKLILHVCNQSMPLLKQVLDEIKIKGVDFLVADECHTLASHKNTKENFEGNSRNFHLFESNIKIKHRFFLTATEKTLINPDLLGEEEVFAYMNNEEYFGIPAFNYSFADAVVAGHIVPFSAKIFEYSNNNSSVKYMLDNKIEEALLREIKILDHNKEVRPLSIKIIRIVTSLMKIILSEKRRKVLVICSRNSHAEILHKILSQIKDLKKVNINKIIVPDYPNPEDRLEELESINESEERHIIVTGPWSITGVDCPSIDSIHWAFSPGNEITSAQGTGRGTRKSKGKEELLVSFDLDIDQGNVDIRNILLTTVVKLYQGQFPSHDVKLRERVASVLGRRFLSVERDNDGEIKRYIRASLDDFYEAASTMELLNYKDSISFFPSRNEIYYSLEEVTEIARKSPYETIEDFFKYVKTREDSDRFRGSVAYQTEPEYEKRGGSKYFLGLDSLTNLKEQIFTKARELETYCSEKKYCLRYSKKIIDEFVGPYLIDEKKFNPSLYLGIKGMERGSSHGPLRNFQDFWGGYTRKFGPISKRIPHYATPEIFKEYCLRFSIKSAIEVEPNNIRNREKKNTKVKMKMMEDRERYGIPSCTVLKNYYGSSFLKSIFTQRRNNEITYDICVEIQKDLNSGMLLKDVSSKYKANYQTIKNKLEKYNLEYSIKMSRKKESSDYSKKNKI